MDYETVIIHSKKENRKTIYAIILSGFWKLEKNFAILYRWKIIIKQGVLLGIFQNLKKS